MAEPAVAIVPEIAPRQRRVQRRFYIGAGVFVTLVNIAGFGPSLIDHSRRYAPPDTLVLVHGAVTAAWLVLFLAQATLVATGRVAIHRRLGWVGLALAAAIIVLGVLISIANTNRPSDLSGDVTRLIPAPPTREQAVAGIWGSLGVVLNFAIFVTAGFLTRHRREVHKRMMLFALSPILLEATLHLSGVLVGIVPLSRSAILVVFIAIQFLFLAVPAIYDKVSTGRIHRASVWIPILYVAWTVFSNVVLFTSAPAYKLAAWLVGGA